MPSLRVRLKRSNARGSSSHEERYGFDDPATPAAVTSEHLAQITQFVHAAVSGQLRMRIARVTQPPGTQILEHETSAGEAIAVIDGALEATVSQGYALKCCLNGLAATIHDREPILAGEGIATLRDTSISYRVSGPTPATLLVLVVVPEP